MPVVTHTMSPVKLPTLNQPTGSAIRCENDHRHPDSKSWTVRFVSDATFQDCRSLLLTVMKAIVGQVCFKVLASTVHWSLT